MARQSAQSVKYNELAVQKLARTPVEKQVEFTVEGVPGLMLVVRPTGVASWLVQYQVGKGSGRKRVRTTLGKYGSIKLTDAREKAKTLVEQATKGVDVVAEVKAKADAMTLRQLFEARLARDKDTAERTLLDYKAILERIVFPSLGNLPANEIKPESFALALEGVAQKAPHTAHKARSGLGSTYRWGMRQWSGGKRLASLNPIATIGFTHQSERRKRNLTDSELKRLWLAIDATAAVTQPMRHILKLAFLTGQRNSEVAGMECAEIIGLDSATPRWDIPAKRMKRKSDDQNVPLSKQAVEIVKAAFDGSSNGVHVFEGEPNGRRQGVWRQEHIGQESVSRAMAKVVATAGLKDVHLHDARKIITSWLAEHGHATSEVLDAILHHGKKGVTGTHYNFALYERQVRQALQVWADHIDSLTQENSSASDKVIVGAFGSRQSS